MSYNEGLNTMTGLPAKQPTTRNNTLQSIATDPPQNQHIVALFSDGSGAEIFAYVSPYGYCNADGDALQVDDMPEWLLDTGFLYWMPLPDDFGFRFMRD